MNRTQSFSVHLILFILIFEKNGKKKKNSCLGTLDKYKDVTSVSPCTLDVQSRNLFLDQFSLVEDKEYNYPNAKFQKQEKGLNENISIKYNYSSRMLGWIYFGISSHFLLTEMVLSFQVI